MKTKVITDTDEIYYTLSKLISKNPQVQIDWLKSVYDKFLLNDFVANIVNLEYVKGYETQLKKAGLFMLVKLGIEEPTKQRVIENVMFFEDISEIEKTLAREYDYDFAYWSYRLFYYDLEDGYKESPYHIGKYNIHRGDGYCGEGRVLLEPDVVYFEGDDNDFDREDDYAEGKFFLDIPDLYEFEFGYIEDDEQGLNSVSDNKEYFFAHSFHNALNYVCDLWKRSNRGYDRCFFETRWHRFYMYIDSMEVEEKTVRDSFGFSNRHEIFKDCIEIETTIKFNE